MSLAIVSVVFAQLLLSQLGCRAQMWHCDPQHEARLQFQLVRECQRSEQQFLALENTQTLSECIALAKSLHGLALNFKPLARQQTNNSYAHDFNISTYTQITHKRNSASVFEQPAEFFNCHVLECPETVRFSGMVNDSRFDYYSLYGRPLAYTNYSCLPGVGLFTLNLSPMTFFNASNFCSDSSRFSGALAHVASENRTNALRKYLQESKPPIYKALVGLYFNRSLSNDFRTTANESLKCFLYSGWDVANPILHEKLANESCVALTQAGTWHTVDCTRKLPFICEIFTPAPNSNTVDIGLNSARECKDFA